jgi:hypothetical protein
MDRIYSSAFRLTKLRSLIESGVFAVPELQREFVWSIRKACDLLDSIYRNYPIGTILVWKTSRRNESQLRKQLHILPHFNPANRHIFFLIDGQQRLSVLWHFLRGQAASVVNADGKKWTSAVSISTHTLGLRIGCLSTESASLENLLSSSCRSSTFCPLAGIAGYALTALGQCDESPSVGAGSTPTQH